MEQRPKKSFYNKEQCERKKEEIFKIGVRNIERNKIMIQKILKYIKERLFCNLIRFVSVHIIYNVCVNWQREMKQM